MILNNISENGIDCNKIQYEKVEKSPRMKDLTGIKFGRLTPLFPVKRPNNNLKHWLCLCDCGNLKVVLPSNLTSGYIRSCGCIRSEKSSQRLTELNHSRILDLRNKQFGQLLVLNELPEPHGEGPGVKYYYKCLCQKCGNITKVRSDLLTSKQKIYCELCNQYYSQGERKIYDLLTENNISFETQKIFDTCRFSDTNFVAKFDFYVNNKYIIEFDGRQHFKDYGNFYFNVPKIQEHDKIKNQWCFENNIPLIRIPYTQLLNLKIQDLLLETSNFILRR